MSDNQMLERKVPKDIRSYKTKVAGPFSLRQLICFILILALNFAIYVFVQKPSHGSMEVYMYVYIAIDILIFSFTLELAGMPMEVYIKEVFFKYIFSPSKRKVKNVIYTPEQKTLTRKEEKEQKKNLEAKLLQHPEWKMYE